MQLDLEKLAAWGPPKAVTTARGPRILRTAPPNPEFSALWKSQKETLKSAGLTWNKNERTGEWSICWWQAPPAVDQEKRSETLTASRAVEPIEPIEIPTPDGLAFMPFQKAGVAFLTRNLNLDTKDDIRGVLLADAMGLGKTLQAIGVINCLPEIKRVLIICPASLKLNWRNELRKWLTRPARIGVQIASQPWVGDDSDIVIVNYDIVRKFAQIMTEQWDLLICDEAHALKNPEAQRTKLILGKRGQNGVSARRKIMVTGTPILNRPVELFPILENLQPGKWTFADRIRYCAGVKNRWGWDFSGNSHLDELQNRLRSSGLMIRRLKSEVLRDLPPKRRQILEIAPNGAADLIRREREAYEAYEERIIAAKAEMIRSELAENEEQYQAAAAQLKEAQAVAFQEMARFRHDVAVAKVPHVIDHLKELLEDGAGKIVVFAHHHDVFDRLEAEFGAKALTITGKTPPGSRQEIVERFNADPAVELLLLSIKAAGVGLSVKASLQVWAELDWVPANISQGEDRCHGIGRGIEGEPLLIQHLVLETSLDARMVKLIVEKQEIADKALDRQTPGGFQQDLSEPIAVIEVPDPAEPAAPSRHVTMPRQEPETITVTEPMRARAHAGLQMLAGMCDGARSIDGHGFSKLDSAIGKSLAMSPRLSDRQAAFALRLCRKYHRQLGDDFLTVS